VPVIVELVLLHGNTRYVILVDVIQTLMCFDDWSGVSVRQEVQHLQHMRMQVAHGLYGHQTTKMTKLQLSNDNHGEAHAISHESWDYPNRESSKYFMTINCIHTTTRGAHICFQTIVLYG
jgi:hypothetical protein